LGGIGQGGIPLIKIINNRGVTLIELMVAVTISALVISGVAFLMRNSSRNYRDVNEEVSLQVEAQMMINQLNDLILEAYNVKFKDNKLKIYHSDTTFVITHDTDNKELLFEKIAAGEDPAGTPELFGRYVRYFSVLDTGEDNRNNQLKVTLKLEYNNSQYSIENHLITLRNRIKPVIEEE
jgi:prepilin-type N-terminal cleavage/methylation domain-containing protein